MVNRSKRRKVQIFAEPPLRQMQQPEEQKQEEGADQDMQGEQPQEERGPEQMIYIVCLFINHVLRALSNFKLR